MSSDDVIVKVENISKRFEIYTRPADRLKQMLFGRFGRQYFKEFWALRDVNLEIRRGECVGIIGKNGAGKSTLLQILVGTLTPTTGNVVIKGRVAALLELGSGFNPEFTGRENVYMNAAILGLTREETDERYQDIVDFADIGDFIDQPVKTYSSGMVVRLAFAVNAFVEPDILIVDEALAVGDLGFQLKCFSQLEMLKKKGTTILFVTHDLNLVMTQCRRVVYIKDGQICDDGYDLARIISSFKDNLRCSERAEISVRTKNVPSNEGEYRFGSHEATIEDYRFFSDAALTHEISILNAGEQVFIVVDIKSERDFETVSWGTSLRNREGMDIWVWGVLLMEEYRHGIRLKKGMNHLVFSGKIDISPGEYFLTVGIADLSQVPRIELDQRWPLRRVVVAGEYPMGGYVYSPFKVESIE